MRHNSANRVHRNRKLDLCVRSQALPSADYILTWSLLIRI
ncbi:protein of unknown function [Methylorubrum extorquens]|uniref:Uncharacterized protein n=1 Tax=Methylorubrum extorquens TaxID=408 RepID=A0A2N9AW43_METEX|nr:protein of unknown function [Methylorubrum extorquens]